MAKYHLKYWNEREITTMLVPNSSNYLTTMDVQCPHHTNHTFYFSFKSSVWVLPLFSNIHCQNHNALRVCSVSSTALSFTLSKRSKCFSFLFFFSRKIAMILPSDYTVIGYKSAFFYGRKRWKSTRKYKMKYIKKMT